MPRISEPLNSRCTLSSERARGPGACRYEGSADQPYSHITQSTTRILLNEPLHSNYCFFGCIASGGTSSCFAYLDCLACLELTGLVRPG